MVMSSTTLGATVPRGNYLLAQWPQEELARVLPHLEAVELLKGRVLFEAGAPSPHVFFPASAIVSLIYTTHSGASSQVAMIGPEGLVGVSSLLGGESPASRAVVLCVGNPLMGDDGVGRVLAFVTSAYSSYPACRQYLDAIAELDRKVGVVLAAL